MLRLITHVLAPAPTLGLALALCFSATTAAASSATTNTTENIRKLWFEGIATGYQSLSDQADILNQAAAVYCQAPSSEKWGSVTQAWQDAFLAWQNVRFVDFGPAELGNRAWQFQFWPDSKNLIGRKAVSLISQDEDINPNVISQAGVAAQGFPMVEYLLFDETLNKGQTALPAEKTCQLLTSVTQTIRTNSQDLNTDWSTFKPHYLETEQYTDGTIRGAMNTLEILENRRLATPMGLSGSNKRSFYRADAWRSGTSVATIEATLEGMKDYFFPAFSELLKARGHSDLAVDIDEQLNEVLDHFPKANRPMAQLLANDKSFYTLQSLYVDVSQLVTLVNDQAAVKIGVVRGFNSSDGD
jgi:predicted lipoprotein